MKRFVIEGEWTGYTSSQRHVVHRTVHQGSERKLREWAEKAGRILYTDGTALLLSVRDCKPREQVREINGYGKLIRDCAFHGVTRVHDLPPSR